MHPPGPPPPPLNLFVRVIDGDRRRSGNHTSRTSPWPGGGWSKGGLEWRTQPRCLLEEAVHFLVPRLLQEQVSGEVLEQVGGTDGKTPWFRKNSVLASLLSKQVRKIFPIITGHPAQKEAIMNLILNMKRAEMQIKRKAVIG